MLTLAFDPSLGCSGWALLSGAALADSTIEDAGTITLQDDAPLADRLAVLASDASDLVRQLKPDQIVVEFPESRARGGGGFGARSVLSLPNYGAAVGALYIGVYLAAPGLRILTPCPSEWVGRGRIPSSRGDEHKEKRVGYVEWLYPAWAGRFGPKTKAGNVADAVLLARWGISHGAYWKTQQQLEHA